MHLELVFLWRASRHSFCIRQGNYIYDVHYGEYERPAVSEPSSDCLEQYPSEDSTGVLFQPTEGLEADGS